MFALIFNFHTRHYHATNWGQHVNEALVAWPPEPWRILRALISSYWCKGGCQDWSVEQLADFVDTLAEKPPLFSLPSDPIHTFTQHYMPVDKNKKSLIFDAFACLPKDAQIVVVWPDVNLDSDTLALASNLATGIGYLGRAESWATCEVSCEWDLKNANCTPIENTTHIEDDENIVSVIAPRSPSSYDLERKKLIENLDSQLMQEYEMSGKKAPSATVLNNKRKSYFGETLPKRIVHALSIDTSSYKKYGWSYPPAARKVLYNRPALSSVPRKSNIPTYDISGNKHNYSVARFALVGRPRPRIEDAVKIGELMRLAALSKFGWHEDPQTKKRFPKAPSEISGRDADGKPLQNASHTHAFWLSEDSDDDGCIDHISVYVASGLSPLIRMKLNQLIRLWLHKGDIGSSKEEIEDSGHQEWRLALEGFGEPKDFEDISNIFGYDRFWISTTPFLATGHLKRNSGYEKEVRRHLKLRSIVPYNQADEVSVKILKSINIHGTPRNSLHFHRFRSRGREKQLDTHGALLRLEFPVPIRGPLAIGYGCHFGLGLFVPDK